MMLPFLGEYKISRSINSLIYLIIIEIKDSKVSRRYLNLFEVGGTRKVPINYMVFFRSKYKQYMFKRSCHQVCRGSETLIRFSLRFSSLMILILSLDS